MVADKGGDTGDPVDAEAQRKEALRKRVLSQEWAGTAMQDLVNKIGDIAGALSRGTATHASEADVMTALRLIDRVRVAGEVAAASIRVCGDEGLELASDTARVESAVAKEELDVQRLRRQLARETRVVEQRDQLEAAAKLVLQLPKPADLHVKIVAARQEAAAKQREVDRVEEAKAAVAREIALLLQCAGSAGEQAKRIDALLSDSDGTATATATATATGGWSSGGGGSAAARTNSGDGSRMDMTD